MAPGLNSRYIAPHFCVLHRAPAARGLGSGYLDLRLGGADAPMRCTLPFVTKAMHSTLDTEDEVQRYGAPSIWEQAPISALLTGSPREDLSQKQLGLLANVIRDE